jgi:SAM-dependent methyltransferase
LAEPGSAPIEYLVADATHLDFGPGRFDLVVCQQGLQFFDDRAAALEAMRRALVPGGTVAIVTWTDHQHAIGYAALADALAVYLDGDAGATMRSAWALDDPAELYDLLDGAGFTDITVRAHTRLVHFITHDDVAREMVMATPLATRFAATPKATQARIANHVRNSIDGAAGGPDAVEYPMTTNIAIAVAPGAAP